MKFTIGIPAFKAKFLRECIDSVLAQTYTDFELIIVNDASPEDIDSIITSYSPASIKYYKNAKGYGAENVVDNWNKCFSYAAGDFFILLGDDDKLAPDYLKVFSELINRFSECDIYHCRTVIIDNHSSTQGLTESRPEFESVYDSILQRMMGNRHFFISDYVFRSVALRNNGGFYKLPLAWGSDDISSYVGAMKNGIAHSNRPVFMYRRNEHTISSTGNVYLKMDAIMILNDWLNTFLLKIPENDVDKILRLTISQELRGYIQKTKIRTIYTSLIGNRFSVFRWFSVRKLYKISIDELVYALVLSFKESRKEKYYKKN